MTLQQLEYVLAVEDYGHFQLAADACGISQPSLSTAIARLEDELDISLFDRSSHPIRPTEMGRRIISQARVILKNAEQLKEMVKSEKEQESGDLKLGVLPSVAPYILPIFIKEMRRNNPGVNLLISEDRTEALEQSLLRAELDVALMVTPIHNSELMEIPLYNEKFMGYVSPEDPLFSYEEIDTSMLGSNKFWGLKEESKMTEILLTMCQNASEFSSVYKAGTVGSLLRTVDENGGYTVFPELHMNLLRDYQRERVRPFIPPVPVREVSLVIRKDYVRERMLNIIAENICRIVPDDMIDKSLKLFGIRL